MDYVEPIRDLRLVENIAFNLKAESERNYIMFVIGIYCGLRVSDILRLRVSDVRNKQELRIIERKTGKLRIYPIPLPAKEAISRYCKGKDKHEYLIRKKNKNEPIKRCRAWKIISDAAKKVGLTGIGTHSMRKTFGYWFYQQTKDVALLMQIFGHDSEAVTLRYIGVTREIIKQELNKFRPFRI